jgi:DNA-binding CsgD family transcriptional regulator
MLPRGRDRLDFAFATPELAGESLVSGNRRAAGFVLGFGRDDRRRRQDLRYCFADPPVQGPSFTADDVQRLDRLRPWLAHAFRRAPLGGERAEDQDPLGAAGAPVASSEMILTSDGKVVFQTNSVEYLLNRVLAGEPGNYTHHMPVGERLPTPAEMLIRRIVGAAKGSLGDPPRMETSNAYGVVTLEAKWLVPKGASLEDIAKDPKSCLISVTIELREHTVAHAARVLRESGATPAQVKVGIQLAFGKTKPVIADELGIKPSSVADQTRRLYQTLDIHNSTELSTKIWLGGRPSETRQSRPPGWVIEPNAALRRKQVAYNGMR